MRPSQTTPILNGTLSEHAASIASALGVDTETFTRLLNDAHIVPGDPGDPGVPVTPDDSLSLDNLSRLFRHASLLKALKLDAPDYLSALQLIESEPFATTAATVVFMQSVRRVRDLGASFAELDYLLRDCAPPGSGLAPTQAAIAMLLRELRDGMQQIGHENSFTGDPDEPSSEPVQDLLRRKLPLLAWGETQVESVMATLSGSIAYEVPLETLPPGLALPNASAAMR